MSTRMRKARKGIGSLPSDKQEQTARTISLGAHLRKLLQDPSEAAAIFWCGGAIAATTSAPMLMGNWLVTAIWYPPADRLERPEWGALRRVPPIAPGGLSG